MTFDQFCRKEYLNHQHRSTHPYHYWVDKYMDELEDGYKAFTEGTF
jgi:hypothetical protein